MIFKKYIISAWQIFNGTFENHTFFRTCRIGIMAPLRKNKESVSHHFNFIFSGDVRPNIFNMFSYEPILSELALSKIWWNTSFNTKLKYSCRIFKIYYTFMENIQWKLSKIIHFFEAVDLALWAPLRKKGGCFAPFFLALLEALQFTFKTEGVVRSTFLNFLLYRNFLLSHKLVILITVSTQFYIIMTLRLSLDYSLDSFNTLLYS